MQMPPDTERTSLANMNIKLYRVDHLLFYKVVRQQI